MQSLNNLRNEIDEIDEKLISLLNRRFKVLRSVLEVKKKNKLSLRDPHREELIIEQLSSSPYSHFLKPIFKELLAQSIIFFKTSNRNSQ